MKWILTHKALRPLISLQKQPLNLVLILIKTLYFSLHARFENLIWITRLSKTWYMKRLKIGNKYLLSWSLKLQSLSQKESFVSCFQFISCIAQLKFPEFLASFGFICCYWMYYFLELTGMFWDGNKKTNFRKYQT